MTVRVVHCRREAFDVYIGRPSIWGNPFSHLPNTLAKFRTRTREEAIARYDEWLDTQPQLLELIPTLAGKILGCWCVPLACHGYVLLRRANPITVDDYELYKAFLDKDE